MVDLDFHKTLAPMVKQVAKSVNRQFPPNILLEDTEQALWLWAYQNEKSISKRILEDPETWIQQIASTMRKEGMSYCLKERSVIEGYASEDYQKYSVKQVRLLLEDVFDHTDWQSFAMSHDGQPRSRGQANATGDRLASLVDVSIALKKLRTEQYNVIVWTYKFGYTVDQIAEEYDCSLDAARKRVERAVGALVRALGPREQAEYTGRRIVRSNAAWMAANSNQYEE